MTPILSFIAGALFAGVLWFAAIRVRDGRMAQLPEFSEIKSVLDQLRTDSAGGITKIETLIQGVAESQRYVADQTTQLSATFHKPGVRGHWGELTLRRVIETAGLHEHVDFDIQHYVKATAEQAAVRPDVIVKLPRGRIIPIDSKMPLDAFNSAMAATDEAGRARSLDAHAKRVKSTIDALGKKAYPDAFLVTPEVVVMFIGSEAVYRAPVECDKDLIAYAARKRVMLATPTTLLPMLQIVAIAWREENLSANVQQVQLLAKRIAAQTRALANHMSAVGKGINNAAVAHNKSVNSFETRLLKTAAELQVLGIEEPLPDEVTRVQLVARAPVVDGQQGEAELDPGAS